MSELPKIVITAPERIWLQVCPDDDECADGDFGLIARDAEVTWCADSQGGVQVEYVRADLSTPGPIDSSSAYSSPIGADPAIEVGSTFNRRLDAVRVEDYERAIREFANDETPDALWCIERAQAIARQRGESNGRS